MQKLPQKTPNKTQEHIAKIAEMFPHVITEGKVDFDLLRQVLSEELVEGSDERYRLDWVGKRASLLKANRSIDKTLRPCKQESVNFDTTENLYIEGDNFEVLKLIGESYLNKIKMIYIDPPYNTGKDFVYRDNFTASKAEYEDELGLRDEEENKLFKNTDSNGRFHSDWLSMMYERLLLSRDLLREDGVILIHIDEHEYANLEKLCDEVFGEDNNLGTIIWDKKNPKGDSKGIAYQDEKIIIFAKDKFQLTSKYEIQRKKKNAVKILQKAEKLFNKHQKGSLFFEEMNIEFKKWINSNKDFSGGEKAYRYLDANGDVYRTVSMAWPNKKQAPKDYLIPLIHPITNKPCPIPERGWRNPSSTMKKLLDENLIIFGIDENKQPERKYLLKENMTENIPSVIPYGGSDDKLFKELNLTFDNPKPVEFVKDLIDAFVLTDDIILDFFSGSATTAHAVMQLNAEDGSNRKFIMVQLPEPTDEKSEAYKAGYHTIAEIGKERIRRAGKKIVEENADKEGIEKLDIGFRVLKVDSSNMKEVYYHPSELRQSALPNMESNIKEDRTPLDLLFATMLDLGIELSLKITPHQVDGATLYAVENNELVACFDASISLEVIEAIKALSPYQVVLKDGSFANDSDKINAIESLSKVATVSVL